MPPHQPRPPVVSEQVVERVPPDPREGWASPGTVVLLGILGLIVGGLVGYLIGHHGKRTTVARGAGPAITHTVTHTTTRPQVVVHTVTAKTVEQTQAPANAENESRRREAEAQTRTLERENEELKRQAEEAGR
ncbi:MAG TPA: hypothetical protein VL988_01220 [Solirubrobacteraceae bacterium]|nr:hypothetical protein [Solirubrobacteraceae bacterium]